MKEKVITGVDKVCDVVRKTLGPKGKNVILKLKNAPAKVTNDGVSIAKAMVLEDEHENVGAELVKQVAVETNRTAGDGTTTSLVLAQAIIKAGLEIGVDVETMRNLQAKGEVIIKELEDSAEQVDSHDKLKQVATISVESEEIGGMIADVFDTIGKDGTVDVEVSATKNTYFELVDGFSFESGYLSTLMANENGKAVYKDVAVLVTDHRIDSVEQILPLMKQLSQAKISNLVIFCAGMSDGVAVVLLQNKQVGAFNSLVVELPRIFTKETCQDIAALVNGNFISREMGYKIQDVQLTDLGIADKIVSDVLTTKIMVNPDSNEKLNAHIKALREQEETPEIKQRIAKLKGGVAVVFIGASTVAELNYKKDKIEDAINATKCALEEGVVAGAGVALRDIADMIEPVDNATSILKQALVQPYLQVLENAGLDASKTLKIASGEGLDLKTGNPINMVKAGIIDPVKVTKTALRNAISLASSVLTAEDVVIEK